MTIQELAIQIVRLKNIEYDFVWNKQTTKESKSFLGGLNLSNGRFQHQQHQDKTPILKNNRYVFLWQADKRNVKKIEVIYFEFQRHSATERFRNDFQRRTALVTTRDCFICF